MSPTRYVFSTSHTIRYRLPTHTNELVLDRAEAEAPPLHTHLDTEQVFYIRQGQGTLEIGGDTPGMFPVLPEDLVRIPARTPHRIHCEGTAPLIYLSVDCFVAGRPEAEPTWESHGRAMCAANGWDFEHVRQAARREE